MRLSDLCVEVRDKGLVRRGQILPSMLRGTFTPVHNGVGSWSLDLPADHDMARLLRTPGSGIIVTGPDDVLLSGPTTSPTFKAGPETPRGLVTVEGVCDNILLDDATAWPQPSNPDPSTQRLSHDVRSGPAETVARAFVDANIGPGAPAARRGLLAQRLTLAADQGRGPATSRSSRFQNLGELLAEIGTHAGLGFRVVQRGPGLVFEVYEPRDRSKFVRFDILTGSLSSQEVQVSPPGATYPIVLGQGQGADRVVITRTNAAAQAAQVEWGRIREETRDRRDTDDVRELEQSGDEILADRGFTATNVRAIPGRSPLMRYGKEWREGDLVSVVIDGRETNTVATQATVLAGPDGVLVGAGLGDVKALGEAATMSGRIDDVAARLSQVERNLEVPQVFNDAGQLDPERIPGTLHGGLELAGNGAYLRFAGGTNSNGLQRTVEGATRNTIGLFDASTRISVGPGDTTNDAMFIVRSDGVLQHSVPGGANIPFAHAEAFVTGTARLTNANSATITITWPAGRFSVAPGCGPSIRTTTALYTIASCIATSSSVTVTVRRIDGAVVTASIAVGVIGIQMTPTSGTG